MACSRLPWGPYSVTVGSDPDSVGTFYIDSNGELYLNYGSSTQVDLGTLTISNGCSFANDSINLTIGGIAYDKITGSLNANSAGGTLHEKNGQITATDPTWQASETVPHGKPATQGR